MSHNVNKTKTALAANRLAVILRHIAVLTTVLGLLLIISPTVHAQEQDPDPTPDVEAYLDSYDTGVPNDDATAKYYNHFILHGTANGAPLDPIDYWTPKKGGSVKIATNTVHIDKKLTVKGLFPVHLILDGSVETWKGI